MFKYYYRQGELMGISFYVVRACRPDQKYSNP
jgi:hypothetical protein